MRELLLVTRLLLLLRLLLCPSRGHLLEAWRWALQDLCWLRRLLLLLLLWARVLWWMWAAR